MYSLNTIFDGMAPTMEKFAKDAHNIGLSQKDAAKASTFLGSVLKQSGFSMMDVTKETQKLVSLGVDLAATYGYDVQEALLGMTALFRGEYDPIEKFGVAMKQSEINAELLARKLNHLTGAERRHAEQVIRMELLYQRAADATGAFTGQSGNLFVEQKKLQAQFENMQASIGTQLLPVMGALVEALVPLVDYIGPKISQAVTDSLPALQGLTNLIKDMSDKSTTTGKTMEFLTTTFGSFFAFVAGNFGVLVQLALLIGGVTIAVQAYTAAATFALAHPFTAVLAAAVTILGGALIIGSGAANSLTTELQKNKAAAESLNPQLQATAYEAKFVGGKMGYLAGATSNATKEARALRDELLNLPAVGSGTVYGGGKGLRNTMRDQNRRNQNLQNAVATATGGGESAAEKAAKELADAQEKAAKELQDALEEAARKEAELLKKREDAYKSFGDSVKSLFGQIKDSILSSFDLPSLGNSVNSITKNIAKLLEKTRSFARNITDLSAQGLNNTLLQQVIQAGPMAGGKLAQALVGGGADFIGQINSAYNEFGGIASQIAGVGTTGAFKDQQTINNYSIEVTGGLATGSDVGRAVVNAIKDYERQSGAAWRA